RGRKASPSAVITTPLALRRRREHSRMSSSRRTCWLIAGCVRPRTSAARPMLPARTAVTKQRNAAVSTSRIIRRSYEVPAKITSSLAWPDRLPFGCVGVCNGLGVLALYSALAHGPVLLVSPLVSTYPLVTLAFAAVLLRSARVTIAHVIGVTTTVAGVMLLVGT